MKLTSLQKVSAILAEMSEIELQQVSVEIDALLEGRKQPLKKIRVGMPTGERQKWWKTVTSIDDTKDNGYAFIGEFLNKHRDIEIEVGTLVLVSDGHRTPDVWLYRVESDGLKELEHVASKSWALDLRDKTAAHLLSK